MKELIEKAEAMMNVILLAAVVLAWACFGSWHDPVAIGSRLYSAVSLVPKEQRTKSMTRFLDAVDSQTGSERRQRVSQVDVHTASAMSGDLASPAFKHADALMHELELIQVRAGSSNSVTFQKLADAMDSQIKLPFIDAELKSNSAIIVLAVCVVGPFVYLLSLMLAIEEAMKEEDYAEGATWLFFHPGKIGACLGSAWLLAPALAIFLSTCFVTIDRHLRVSYAVGLAVIAVFPIAKAIRLRRSFRGKRNVPRKT
jgi:hypothetical protein